MWRRWFHDTERKGVSGKGPVRSKESGEKESDPDNAWCVGPSGQSVGEVEPELEQGWGPAPGSV